MSNVQEKTLKRKLKKMKNKQKKRKTDDGEAEEVTNQNEADCVPTAATSNGDQEVENEVQENGEDETTVPNTTPSMGSGVSSSILTETTFASLSEKEVSDQTLKAVKEMGFTNMTQIQEKSIAALLDGRDLMGAAKTGSGKTLAFLVPAIELLYKLRFLPRNGTGCVIISPTRELSLQTYGVLTELLAHHKLTHGLIMGGANRVTEAHKLAKGVNIVVATPGRLLDHLNNTKEFVVKNLKCLVIDEADRIMDVGFEQELQQIVRLLPKKRQTMLFSATQSKKIDDLAKLALSKEPLYVGVADDATLATVEGLQQGYVACPSESRFLLLFTFLKKNRNKKVMVFMSSCAAVKFFHELLNYIDLPVTCIHGKQKQQKRTTTFFSFSQADSGIMLCTDVAARGLDIPRVDWIVQYDPPDDPKEYIHRVGRTARGDQGIGNALLILRPEELGFLRYLKHARVPLNEYEFSWNKVANIQPQLEKLISQNYYLNKSAKDAYRGYIRAYDSHALKEIFDLNTLELNSVAKSFGFETPPYVDLPVGGKSKVAKMSRKTVAFGYAGQRQGRDAHKMKIYSQKTNKHKSNDNRQFAK